LVLRGDIGDKNWAVNEVNLEPSHRFQSFAVRRAVISGMQGIEEFVY
jgi:hypothetical protein